MAAVEAAPGAVDEVVLAVEVDSAAGAVVVLPVVVPVVEVSFPSIQSSLATPLHLFSFLFFSLQDEVLPVVEVRPAVEAVVVAARPASAGRVPVLSPSNPTSTKVSTSPRARNTCSSPET